MLIQILNIKNSDIWNFQQKENFCMVLILLQSLHRTTDNQHTHPHFNFTVIYQKVIILCFAISIRNYDTLIQFWQKSLQYQTYDYKNIHALQELHALIAMGMPGNLLTQS